MRTSAIFPTREAEWTEEIWSSFSVDTNEHNSLVFCRAFLLLPAEDSWLSCLTGAGDEPLIMPQQPAGTHRTP